LAARFGSAAPKIPDKRREERAREYVAARAHKAQAVAPNVGGTWRATGRPSAENAQTASLEQCQIFYGEPCVLVAVNDLMQPVPVDGNWIRHDMQRPRYADVFDPEQIPGAGPGLRNRSDIVNYRTAPAPKAAAYHPSGGRLFTVSGAASQRSAEEDVLKACNIDPSREGKDGSCFLYAVGDQVVLPRRVKDAVTSTAPLRDLLAMRLASAAPGRPSKVREDVSKEYETARQHKAQAAAPPDVVWHTAGRPTAANAEESALESCQVVSGTPCALIALDDALQPMPVDGNWPRRDMPRARYAGSFDPAQLPGTWPSVRERADVLGYRQAAGPKAAAFHPAGGRVFIVTGAADQRAAEEAALQACGADRLPFPVGGSCFLYAAGDQVVLPQRLKAPMAKER